MVPLRRLPRKALVLASALPLVVSLWSAAGARAAGPVGAATCAQAVGDAVQLDCGGPATHLIFFVQPGDATIGQLLNPQPVVEAVDDSNIPDANYAQNITLTIDSNPGGGTLHTTTSVQAVNGVATFTDLTIDQPGNGYTLDANGPLPVVPVVVPAFDDSLPTVTSDPFDILPVRQGGIQCGTIYGVNDVHNDSRFYMVRSDAPHTLTALGGVHKESNFESIDYSARDQTLYAVTAGGNQHGKKGFVYSVDPVTGALTPLFSTHFRDVEGIAYSFDDATLWGWVDGKGLIQIDPATQTTTLVQPSGRHFEAMSWDAETGHLWLAKGSEVWSYDPVTHAFSLLTAHAPGNVLGMDSQIPTGEIALALEGKPRISIWIESTQTTLYTVPTPGFRDTQSLAWTTPCQTNPG